MLLITIGLAVDIVGAWVLALGLFRGIESAAVATTWDGWEVAPIRSPETVAKDRSSGMVGGIFLTGGFSAQFIGALGVGPQNDRHMALIVGPFAILVAWGLALVALEVARRYFKRRVR